MLTDASALRCGRIEDAMRGIDRQARRAAIQELIVWAQKDPTIGAAALRLLRRTLETAGDVSTANAAIAGIDEIVGFEEGRRTLLDFLIRAPQRIAAGVALSVKDPSLAPLLIEALSRRSEAELRISLIRALGRLANPAVFPALKPYLDQAELRPHVIAALGDLEDGRAIPDLARFLDDKTGAWPIDNHGPMLCVGDLAQSALRSIKAATAKQGR